MVLGCRSKKQKGGQMKKLASVEDGLNLPTYKRLLAAFVREYPWLEAKEIFYKDTGAKMQRLEGEIGLEMFRWALDRQMPILSVHDSFAVKTIDANATWSKMIEVWQLIARK